MPADLLLLRHGETDWSREGRHTGLTDMPLTSTGERQAAALADELALLRPTLVLSSPLQRAVRTAELAGLTVDATDGDLVEWDYGAYEGITTAEIQVDRPGWSLWADGVPPGGPGHPGEDAAQVGARCDRALARVAAHTRAGDLAVLVAHGHLLRVLAARWLGLEPDMGRLFALGTTARCLLGQEHGRPVITRWNLPAPD